MYKKLQHVPVVRGLLRIFMPKSTVQVGGVTLEIHPADNYSDRVIWMTGSFDEEKSIEALLSTLPEEKCLFVDIGGNAGIYALLAARKLAASSRVVTFEPNPIQQARLKQNIALNGLEDRVDLKQVAIGGEDGTATLMVERGNLGEATLNPMKLRKESSAVEVEMRHLNGMLSQYAGYDFLAVKVDVEGYEDEVLYDYLTSTPAEDLPDVMLLEVSHHDLWSRNLFDVLSDIGFVVSFDAEGNRLYTNSNKAR